MRTAIGMASTFVLAPRRLQPLRTGVRRVHENGRRAKGAATSSSVAPAASTAVRSSTMTACRPRCVSRLDPKLCAPLGR